MSGAHHTLIQLLILKLINAGAHGNTFSQYVKAGVDASLLCNNMVNSDCSLTTWRHYTESFPNTIQEVSEGKVCVNSKRAGRLSVDAGCSLHVHNVTAEDAGLYTCIDSKHQNQSHTTTDTYLSVLTILVSTAVTDLKPDRPVTLRCSLYTKEGHGNCMSSQNHKVRLSWVDETGTKLQGSGCQLTGLCCDSTLTVTLQEDNNRKWTCQLTKDGKFNTSIDFTSTFSDIKDTDDEKERNDSLKQSVLIWVVVGVGVAGCVAGCVAALVVTFRRRAYSVSRNQIPVNPGNVVQANKSDGQRADITYADVNLPPSRRMVERDQQTEYATIRTGP
ncbi:uncharacterized protein LOC121549238 [Coregonus clupeaformis]|uniref:uncharacterized protein LOC121549238 n=1 Tax=Coregonus clupeaformis TaxID=59861 RepID=UPI001BE05E5A|nr:uncharacterized protein LOC121549238 [Coregonus clupeaformis]